MTHERERTLDDEGVPDLEGPLPEKEATGDPQEGLAPPNEAPGSSVDRRVVPAEERRSETVEERLLREEADIPSAAPTPQPRDKIQTSDPDGTRDDTGKDVIADAAPVEGALEPEEEAMRVESTEANAEEER